MVKANGNVMLTREEYRKLAQHVLDKCVETDPDTNDAASVLWKVTIVCGRNEALHCMERILFEEGTENDDNEG